MSIASDRGTMAKLELLTRELCDLPALIGQDSTGSTWFDPFPRSRSVLRSSGSYLIIQFRDPCPSQISCNIFSHFIKVGGCFWITTGRRYDLTDIGRKEGRYTRSWQQTTACRRPQPSALHAAREARYHPCRPIDDLEDRPFLSHSRSLIFDHA